MPLPVIPNVYRVSFLWKHTADALLNAVNVMHFHAGSTDAEAVAGVINDNVNFAMWQHTSTASEIYQFDVTPLDGSSLTFSYVVTDETNYKGSAGTTDVIPQVACVVKLLTNKRGRNYRGRVFLPWVNEGSQVNGEMVGSNVTGLQTAWVSFLGAMAGDSCNLCVASYKLATSDNVAAIAVETPTATLRRRQKR